MFKNFLGIGSLVFSGTQQGVMGPCGVVYDRARFSENHVLLPKWGKWAKLWVLLMYRKVQFFSQFFIFFYQFGLQ